MGLWRKIHISIRAIEVTSSGIGDNLVLPHLLNQIPSNQEIGSVTADGAHDTRYCKIIEAGPRDKA
jgi:hypothetical protein